MSQLELWYSKIPATCCTSSCKNQIHQSSGPPPSKWCERESKESNEVHCKNDDPVKYISHWVIAPPLLSSVFLFGRFVHYRVKYILVAVFVQGKTYVYCLLHLQSFVYILIQLVLYFSPSFLFKLVVKKQVCRIAFLWYYLVSKFWQICLRAVPMQGTQHDYWHHSNLQLDSLDQKVKKICQLYSWKGCQHRKRHY